MEQEPKEEQPVCSSAPPPGYAPEVGDSVSHDGCHPVRLTMLSERFAVVVVNGREHTLYRDEYLDMTRRAIAKGAVLKRSHNRGMGITAMDSGSTPHAKQQSDG